jgi:hypothetical protein
MLPPLTPNLQTLVPIHCKPALTIPPSKIIFFANSSEALHLSLPQLSPQQAYLYTLRHQNVYKIGDVKLFYPQIQLEPSVPPVSNSFP